MIHRVTLKTEIGGGMVVEHTFEHMTEEEDDAREAGEQDALLAKAWMEGFGQADLT